jgi:hypothetical protein
LRLLFESVAGPVARPDTPGGFWRGRRVLSVDGTTVDAADTAANWARFGGPGAADESDDSPFGVFPKVRVVALAECGTRALVAARLGSFATPAEALTWELLPLLGKGMLVLAAGSYAGYDLWGRAAATGADLLWRVGSSVPLPVGTILADGSYLSRLVPPRKLARAGAAPTIVRVVKYHLWATDPAPTQTFALLSTLLDVQAAPAAELAELYRARWQIESAFGAFTSQLKYHGVVLRSKTPDGAEQELWALLCAYQAIRELISAAADLSDQGPPPLSLHAAPGSADGPALGPARGPAASSP